jgi:arginine:agmatine antiporter
MVGSGFYLSPAAVARYGNLAILAWLVMGAGAICLGLTFAKLAKLAPATGGPYAYTRIAYGEFAGFLTRGGPEHDDRGYSLRLLRDGVWLRRVRPALG